MVVLRLSYGLTVQMQSTISLLRSILGGITIWNRHPILLSLFLSLCFPAFTSKIYEDVTKKIKRDLSSVAARKLYTKPSVYFSSGTHPSW